MTSPLAPDVPSPSDFGPEMINADPIEDPRTDFDALYFNRMRAQLAALSRTAWKAHVKFLVSIPSGAITLADHIAVWDETNSLPLVTRIGVGNYLITWPSTVFDLQDIPESHDISFSIAQATASYDSSHVMFAPVIQVSTNSVRVLLYGTGGALTDAPEIYVSVR